MHPENIWKPKGKNKPHFGGIDFHGTVGIKAIVVDDDDVVVDGVDGVVVDDVVDGVVDVDVVDGVVDGFVVVVDDVDDVLMSSLGATGAHQLTGSIFLNIFYFISSSFSKASLSHY